MARFNQPTEVKTRTTNLAGGDALVESPELELASILLTSFVQDKFYRSATAELGRIAELADQITDKSFVGKAAVFARKEFYMRSVSHAGICEFARTAKGTPGVRDLVAAVVLRPDDMTEILSYWKHRYGKYPHALLEGLRRAFAKFDRYQLAKYRGEGKDVSLVDVVNLVHPEPVNEAQAGALKALVEGTLKSVDTWEARMTEAGKGKTAEEKKAAKAEVWADLLKQGKLGYMALVRNLRNILTQAPALVETACEQLVDPKRVHKSRLLPFRFQTAIDELGAVSGSRSILVALAKALEIAVDNVPAMPGRTLVALDESGSMSGGGPKGPFAIGSLFAAVLYKAWDADLMLFTSDARYVNLDPTNSVAGMVAYMRKDMKAQGTNFHSIFRTANRVYDRIVILSDMQAWEGDLIWSDSEKTTASFARYCKDHGCRPKVWSFDLRGYGTLQFPEPDIFTLAGFSEKVFDLMEILEQDRNVLVNTIRNYAV